jgi:hypothetical protein
MSPPGRPKGETWSARHEGSPVSKDRATKRERRPVTRAADPAA